MFGPQKDTDNNAGRIAFYTYFFIEFSPWLIDVIAFKSTKKFYRSKRSVLLSSFHFVIGIILIIAFERPNAFEINLSNLKGFVGLFCICSAYSLFGTFRDAAPPYVFEKYGWFEVVFWNITKLLAVSK